MKKTKGSFQPPCEECGGKCCNYIAIQIDKPVNKKDYDYIRWYLTHKNVNIFIDHERNWYVEFRTPCDYHQKNNRCSIYTSRPEICRQHGNGEGECEFYDTPYSAYFSSLGEFENYLTKINRDWKYRKHQE